MPLPQSWRKRTIQPLPAGKPEVVDPEDLEMLSDLIIAATNEALRAAAEEKNATLEKISGGLNVPGMF